MNTKRRRRLPAEVRRAQIIRAAVRIFARRGYERTTTKEIARAAGISEGLIYKYFGSKQRLLFVLLEEAALQPDSSLLMTTNGDGGEQAIRRFLEDRLSVVERGLPLLKVVFGEALFNRKLAKALCQRMTRPTMELVEAFIAQRIDEGRFCVTDTTIAARALIGLAFSFSMLWDALLCKDGKRFPREEVVERLTSLFLDGVRNRAGEDRLEIKEGHL